MKRLMPLLLALVLVISAAVPAYATGDGNFDGGGGSMGDGTKTNYWNPGMDGVRVSVIHADSQAVTGTVFDLTNKVPSTGLAHFGKVSKLSYNTGKSIVPKAGNYTYINPSQSLPKIISTSSSKASSRDMILFIRIPPVVKIKRDTAVSQPCLSWKGEVSRP